MDKHLHWYVLIHIWHCLVLQFHTGRRAQSRKYGINRFRDSFAHSTSSIKETGIKKSGKQIVFVSGDSKS